MFTTTKSDDKEAMKNDETPTNLSRLGGTPEEDRYSQAGKTGTLPQGAKKRSGDGAEGILSSQARLLPCAMKYIAKNVFLPTCLPEPFFSF
jgi:hypothetical protein